MKWTFHSDGSAKQAAYRSINASAALWSALARLIDSKVSSHAALRRPQTSQPAIHVPHLLFAGRSCLHSSTDDTSLSNQSWEAAQLCTPKTKVGITGRTVRLADSEEHTPMINATQAR